MLRLAAERAGVSPVYLHNLSDKFAILIEKISTFAELSNMGNKLIHEYKKKSMAPKFIQLILLKSKEV